MSFGPLSGTPSTASNRRSTRPCAEVDALDAPARVVVGLMRRPHRAVGRMDEMKSAVVADVRRAVRADRGAVRPAAELGDALDAAVRRHARERATGDLDDEHRAVVEGHRAFGKRSPDAISRNCMAIPSGRDRHAMSAPLSSR
jgi:hypothetical protein